MNQDERNKRIDELKKELFLLEHTCNCKKCGKEFMSNNNSKYCSQSCRNKAYLENMSDEQKRKREQTRKKYEYKKYLEKIETQEIPDIYYSTEKIINLY